MLQALRRKDNVLVALKAIRKEEEEGESSWIQQLKDWDRETKALKLLSEPPGNLHVCRMFDQHEDDEHFYLAMELIGGGELFEHLIKKGAFSELEASKSLSQFAEALDCKEKRIYLFFSNDISCC